MAGASKTTAGRLWIVALTGLAAAAGAQLPPPPEPPGNPVTPSKALLGKVLFWDEQLSSTRTVSCGTCHIPAAGGDDPRSGASQPAVHPGPDGVFGGPDDVFGSPGVPLNHADGSYSWQTAFGLLPQVTPRRTVSAINAGYSPELFWDGRAGEAFVDPVTMVTELPFGAALESQAVGPPVNEVEMGHVGRDWLATIDRIATARPLALAPSIPTPLRIWINGRSYPELFEEAFGSPGISATRAAMAIASYERTQFTNQTPFDQFLATNTGLTPQEASGRVIFAGVGRCDNCHQFAIMSDHAFHYTGVRPRTDDIGRSEVTGLAADEGKMRTPSLRNVALRAPYMHNGRLINLTEVVEFYDRGGDFTPNELGPPLGLTPQQKADLIAFLGRPLTDPRLAAEQPPFDRPRLYTESPRVPSVQGTGILGSGGHEPRMVALEPALVGNPSFTVGVWNRLGGASALLAVDDQDPGLLPPVSAALVFETTVLGGVGAGAGFGSISVAIAEDSSLVGKEWFGRWYVTDPAAAGGVAVSPLVRFRTFAPIPTEVVLADGFEAGDTTAWSATVP